MSNFKKTILTAVSLCSVFVLGALYIQLKGRSSVYESCSYLDPITIDVFAFMAGLFLVSEGAYKIIKYKHVSVGGQFTRIVRVAFGLAIITIHILQFIHK